MNDKKVGFPIWKKTNNTNLPNHDLIINYHQGQVITPHSYKKSETNK